MSDYPYPKAKGEWHDLRVVDNPYPQQIRALELIRDGLRGNAPLSKRFSIRGMWPGSFPRPKRCWS
jgi:hypothetical protein